MEKTITDFWLFKKHFERVEITDLFPKMLWQQISDKTGIPLTNKKSKLNTNFEWEENNSFNFFFEYVNCTDEISSLLEKSSLKTKKFVYVETASHVPMCKVEVDYFIKHWYDFASANNGMGSIVISDDFLLLMEFTDDADYLLYSNFKIK